jgi:hypothetical protein
VLVRVVALLGLLEGIRVLILGEVLLVFEYRELSDALLRRDVDDVICETDLLHVTGQGTK